jgi:transcriptional regulator with XRE-family HTH domain
VDKPAFQKRLARRVRELRETAGLRQDELESYKLHWKTIQKLEYGITDPKLSTLLKLCRAFDVTLAELLHGISDDRPSRRRRRL